MPKLSWNKMTDAALDELVQALIFNATSLLHDAAILMNAGRFPRACSLAILGTEEISKLPFVWLRRFKEHAPPELLYGDKELNEIMTDHGTKLVMSDLMTRAYQTIFLDKNMLESLKEELVRSGMAPLEAFAKGTNILKQDGFYVTTVNHRPLTPEVAISADDAYRRITLLRVHLNLACFGVALARTHGGESVDDIVRDLELTLLKHLKAVPEVSAPVPVIRDEEAD